MFRKITFVLFLFSLTNIAFANDYSKAQKHVVRGLKKFYPVEYNIIKKVIRPTLSFKKDKKRPVKNKIVSAENSNQSIAESQTASTIKMKLSIRHFRIEYDNLAVKVTTKNELGLNYKFNNYISLNNNFKKIENIVRLNFNMDFE